MRRLSPEEELLKLFWEDEKDTGRKSSEIDPKRIPKPYFGFPLKTIDDWKAVVGWFLDCLNNIDGYTESFGKLAGVIIDIVESPEYFKVNKFIDMLNDVGRNSGFPKQDVQDLIALLNLVSTSISAFLQLQRELFKRGKLSYPTGGILYPFTAEGQMQKLQEVKVLGTPKAKEIILKGLELEEKMRNATTYSELRDLQEALERYSYNHLTDLRV